MRLPLAGVALRVAEGVAVPLLVSVPVWLRVPVVDAVAVAVAVAVPEGVREAVGRMEAPGQCSHVLCQTRIAGATWSEMMGSIQDLVKISRHR